MPHIIQQNLAAEIEWPSSLKFPITQNFQIPTAINCLNIMLLLFLAIIQIWLYHKKKNVIWAVSAISPTGYNIIWYAYDERNFFSIQILKLSSVLVVVVQASLERFTSFLIGLTDLDNSGIFIFFFFFLSIFQKIRICLKMLFEKIKPIKSSCFLYIKKKIIKKLLRSILKRFLFKYCVSLIQTLQHRHFW